MGTMPANSRSVLKLVLPILLLLSAITALLITQFGDSAAYLLITFTIGVALSIFSILFPVFGMYLCIFIAFFVSDLERYLRAESSLTVSVDYFILATFVGVVIKKILNKESFWKNFSSPIIYAYLLYTAYTLIQIFNPNVDSFTGMLNIIRKFLTLLLFYYCVVSLFTDRKSIERFFKVWVGIAMIVSLYGCCQEWFGLPPYDLEFIQSSELLTGLYRLDNGDFRKFSSMADPKAFGLLMAATALIPLVFFLNFKAKNKTKFYWIVSVIIFLLGMTYSGTRTANFMLIMGIVLYVFMTISNLKTLIFTGMFAMVFVVIIYGPIYGNVTINRIRSTFDLSSEESLQVRDINRHNIQPYIYAHPMGGGLGTTGILGLKNSPTHPLSGFPTDSGLLQAALEIGWIGLLLQCSVYFIIIQQGVRAYFRSRNPINRGWLLAATISLFSYMVSQYAQVAIGGVPGTFLFFGLIAIIIRLPQMEKEENL